MHKNNERPRIYVAGPMTSNKVLGPYTPIGDAARIASLLYAAGWLPFVPQLNSLWEIVCGPLDDTKPAGGWLDYDFGWLDVCHAIYRMPGDSDGADQETTRARIACKPRFDNMMDARHPGGAWEAWSRQRGRQFAHIDGPYVSLEAP